MALAKGKGEMSTTAEEVSFPILFAMAGIRKGSADWRDYEIGKSILRLLPERDYERGIEELKIYLGL